MCACLVSSGRSEKNVRFLGTGVIDMCETAHGCWELNSGLWKSSKGSYELSHRSSLWATLAQMASPPGCKHKVEWRPQEGGASLLVHEE